MTFIVADRVQETTNSPGTGTATLLGAVSGYQSFSTGIGANNTTFYVIADQLGTNWEVGLGALNSTGTVLTRTTVYSSSNGGSTVNFATGTQYVWCDYPSSKAVIQGTAVNFSSIGATTAGTGAFTTLSASSTVSGAGFSNYFAAPPTIGNTTPNTGAFTALVATSITDSGLTSGRVTYATTGGLLTDSANMTFNGTTLTLANDASIHGVTVGLGANSVANNTAVGGNALVNSSLSGGFNTGIGANALTAVTTGAQNTGVGSGAGQSITTGVYNTCVGYAAGGPNATTVQGATYIGAAMNASSSTANYEIAIGFNLTGKGSTTFYAGTNGGNSYQGNNTTLWSISSDQRLKKNIVDNNVGLDKINQIQVRNFEYRLPEEITELETHTAINKKGEQLGVIAQELQLILPDCVSQESTGVLAVTSDNIMWHMVNAIKELSAKVTALENK